MGVGQELDQHILRASSIEKPVLLPPDASFFHRKLAEVVTDILRDEMGSFSLGLQVACEKTINRMLPLVDFLTQSRSIAEFQKLKRGLLRVVHDHHFRTGFFAREDCKIGEKRRMIDVVEWMDHLLPGLGIFPNPVELDLLRVGKTPDEVWQMYERVESKPPRWTEDKIVSFEEVVDLRERWRQEREGRVGYSVGKWRVGPHQGHIDLFQPAKEVLGRDGLLIIGVESQRSIQQRRGKNHRSFGDKERLIQIAALEAVDYAVLLDPSDEELVDLGEFYYQVWQNLDPDFVFFGSADYHWREEFERRAHELGSILLWEWPTVPFSTSKLIEQIRKAS